jgi:dipeptidyl aminopeptidase/acylaminoacyl peptidase
VFDAKLDVTLKVAGYHSPAWLSADRLVVAGEDCLFTLPIVAAPAFERLGRPGTAPDRLTVSPDGRSVAFLQDDLLWRIGVDGSGLTQLTVASATANWPTWSPDGSRIALVNGVCGQLAGPDIVVVSATRTNQNLYRAATVKRHNGAPARSCGPVYWL